LLLGDVRAGAEPRTHQQGTRHAATQAEFFSAEVEPIEERRGQSPEAAPLSRAVLDAYQVYANFDFSSLPPGPYGRFRLPSIGDPGLLADTVAPLLSISIEQRQKPLETSDVVTRLQTILDLMNAGRPTN
jgi:uncharacterized protein